MQRNNGVTWLPIARDVVGNSIDWDTTSYPGSQAGKLRLLVTDGLLTTEDRADSVLTLGAHPPQISILTPGDSTSLVAGRPVELRGTGIDLESGAPTTLRWSSNLQGFLGTAPSLMATLQPGWHRITLEGEDADGLRGESSVNLQALSDTDGDGMPDSWEGQYAGLDPAVDDGAIDVDRDSLTNRDEYRTGTDPTDPDTDDDGFYDGIEVAHFSNPLSRTDIPVSVDLYGLPRVLAIRAYPNPLNPSTTIRFVVPREGRSSIRVYDVAGRFLRTLVDRRLPAGFYATTWNGGDSGERLVSSGVYIARLVTEAGSTTLKLVIVR